MLNRFECWNISRNEMYLYTEDCSIAKELKKEFHSVTVYFRGIHPFAWQFLVPARILPVLKKRYNAQDGFAEVEAQRCEKESIENKQLTAA